jgi:hypothetical protein
MELDRGLEVLRDSDPDYVVDVLGLTSEQIVEAFHWEAIHFIRKETGDGS